MPTNVAKQILAAFALFIGLISAEKCLPGTYHKKTSSPATEEYAECKAWSSDTCCTANFTEELNKTRTRELYGFHWGHCKNISKACEKFLIEEECFFSCEPRLIKWQLVDATIKDVPICGDYCDDWYEACKDDETCTHDWFGGFDYTNGMYTCPRNSKCQTFKELYGNGTKLCDTMWGQSFRYVDPKCPCSRMDGPIPANVNEKSVCSAYSITASLSSASRYVDPKSSCSRMDGPTPANVNKKSVCSACSITASLSSAFWLLILIAINVL